MVLGHRTSVRHQASLNRDICYRLHQHILFGLVCLWYKPVAIQNQFSTTDYFQSVSYVYRSIREQASEARLLDITLPTKEL